MLNENAMELTISIKRNKNDHNNQEYDGIPPFLVDVAISTSGDSPVKSLRSFREALITRDCSFTSWPKEVMESPHGKLPEVRKTDR